MPESDSPERRAALHDAFVEVRQATERLAAPLSPEDQTVQSMPDVSPTKWHRAHTSWFFETFCLEPGFEGYECFNPAFAYLFNSYYEAVGARHPRAERGLVSRPGIDEVAAYRRHVDDAMDGFFHAGPSAEELDLMELGVHHEQQHQELLLMDIKHVLSRNPMLPAYADAGTGRAGSRAEPPKLGWHEHDGGLVDIGHGGHGFAFDNEAPRHAAQLVPFALADRLATCGEWLAFMDDGGYERPELWLSDGWAAVQENGWRAPLYFSEAEPGHHRVFTLYGDQDVDPGEPVAHVSYYEADAFARWSGARLPTEAEWEAVASTTRAPAETAPADRLHPRQAVDDDQLCGALWQWTSSAYSPYPGFRTGPGAVGEYNGKFMVNQQVLRGSACITPPSHARHTYRNFFPAGARWAFSGVRLGRDL